MAIPDDTTPISQTPEVARTPTIPPTKIPTEADLGALLHDVILLQGEMNRAMGYLLMTIDTQLRKQVSDFKTAFCKNEAKTTKTIREAKACCGAVIMEAEACCTTDIREVEACCADHACSIQQLHSDSMQHLEREAMEEEERDHLSFLATCGVALQACPQKPVGY